MTNVIIKIVIIKIIFYVNQRHIQKMWRPGVNVFRRPL